MAITVTVPATTANLGPGFDCLGAALGLYNRFTFRPLGESGDLAIVALGQGCNRVTTDASNLVYQAMVRFYGALGQPVPGVAIEIEMGVALARGLGSSATAIVGGLLGANAMAGSPWDLGAIGDLATAIEGHPDNVIPALLGGCRLAATGIDVEGNRPWIVADIPWHDSIVPIVAIPEFELSTATARQVLPPNYSRADAVFNIAHAGLLLRGIETGNGTWLAGALQDKIHQPYRKALIQGYDAVEAAAIGAGAYGVVISGAGPTILALAGADRAAAVAAAMGEAWAAIGVAAEVVVSTIDRVGARITVV
jgi:homoserine kinase